MNDEKILIRRFNAGDTDALRRIYERYRSDLVAVAAALLFDPARIEDVLHDVFVQFAGSAGRFKLKGSLKGYLAVCVANRARNANRRHRDVDSSRFPSEEGVPSPVETACREERHRAVAAAVQQLPEAQRRVVALHVLGSLRFREIAQMEDQSIHTIQSRYRYGLQKLQSLLNGEVDV